MRAQKICFSWMLVTAGLLLLISAGAAFADECSQYCADDLKECRKQVDIAANREAHPLMRDSSARMYKGQEDAMVANKVLPTAPNEEIQKRADERYRTCANANANCRSRCTTASAKPKISVILK